MMMSLRTIRAAGIGFVLVSGVAMCSMRDAKLKQEGAARVVESVAKQTEKTSEKASKARAAARAPGAVDRVRNAFCRDCN